MNVFPNIIQIASHPDSTISQYREDNVWNLILRRNLNDWELEEVFSLMAIIQTSAINSHAGTNLSGDIAGTDPTQLKHATFDKAPRRP